MDLKEAYTDDNTDSTTPHNDYRALSQNHIDGLAAQIAELAHYAAGKRRLLTTFANVR